MKRLKHLQELELEIRGIPFKVVLSCDLGCSGGFYDDSTINQDEVLECIHECSYKDHRGYWIDTGFRPSDMNNEDFMKELYESLIKWNELQYNKDRESFIDELYDWGYSYPQSDQLDFN